MILATMFQSILIVWLQIFSNVKENENIYQLVAYAYFLLINFLSCIICSYKQYEGSYVYYVQYLLTT